MTNTSEFPTNREIWETIDSYKNYEVSWFGRVRNAKTGRILKSVQANHGYLVVNLYNEGKRKLHFIHALVAREWVGNPNNKRCVDHADGNKTNNHYENLRYATHIENGRNRKIQTNGTSVYKGVGFHKPMKKWRAQLTIDGKLKHLGYFENEKEAAVAYNAAADEYYRKYAKLNEIKD